MWINQVLFQVFYRKEIDLNVSHDLNRIYLIWWFSFSFFGGGVSTEICRGFAPGLLFCVHPYLFFFFVVVFTVSSAALQQKKNGKPIFMKWFKGWFLILIHNLWNADSLGMLVRSTLTSVFDELGIRLKCLMFVSMCDFSHCKQGFDQQEASQSHCGPAGQSVLSPLLIFFLLPADSGPSGWS